MLKRVFPKPEINHQQWLDARCQIYSRIKNKGFSLKLHKSAKKGKEKVKNSRQIWESWIPPVIFWKLDNHTIEFPKSFHFENLPRNFFKKKWNFTQHNKFFHDEDNKKLISPKKKEKQTRKEGESLKSKFEARRPNRLSPSRDSPDRQNKNRSI